MKTKDYKDLASDCLGRRAISLSRPFILMMLITLLSFEGALHAQTEDQEEVASEKPVRSIFGSALIIDNQTVLVPVHGTFEFDIQHRFGNLQNGVDDLFGLYANSNIRLGFSYVPVENLSVGIGLTKFKNLLDFSAKYALFQQSRSGKIPLSLTYYVNAALDTRDKDRREEVFNASDRWSFFHQLIIARKFTNWLSFQVAPSLSHYNIIHRNMSNDHVALAFGAEIRLSGTMALIGNVDQPLTRHDRSNPNPNVSLGLQMTSSAHAFQVFVGNYNSIIPQENNLFNKNNYSDGFKENFLIGFNITRLWTF